MAKQNKISSLDGLIKAYEGEQSQHPFLLVDLAGGNENFHTNVLSAVLKFKGFSFLEYFLENVIRIPIPFETIDVNSIRIQTQKKAIGLKGNKPGFIDLYIEFNDIHLGTQHRIVIENKINGAGDTEKQMLRYIASIKENHFSKNGDFLVWASTLESNKSTVKEECRNCHFVYLSLDGTGPGEDSLPPYLYDDDDPVINYYPINYQDDILTWLKDVVLQECPYFDDGITIAGLRQYIASLERLVQRNVPVSPTVQEYVEGIDAVDSTKYNRLLEEMVLLRKKDKQDYMDLWRELKQETENIYSAGAVDPPWHLHFTPSFLLLYKSEWMTIGKRAYSIPFVHLCATNKISPKKASNKLLWVIHIEHYSMDRERPKTLKYTNHGKTACIPLPETENVELGNRENAEDRRVYFKKIIKTASRQISAIKESFEKVRNDEEALKDDKLIGTALLREISSRLCSDTKSDN